MGKDAKKYLDSLEDRGYEVIYNKGHYKVYAGNKLVTVAAGTSGDRRSLLNLKSNVRKHERELSHA